MEGRLRALLGQRQSRRALSRGRAGVVWLVAAGLLLPLAALRPAPEGKAAVTPVHWWTATTSRGVTVEIVGVSRSPSKGRSWWTAAGAPLARAPYQGSTTASIRSGGDEGPWPVYEFVVRATSAGGGRFGLLGDLQGANADMNSDTLRDRDGGQPLAGLRLIESALPPTVKVGTLRLQIAAGPWETFLGYSPRSNRSGASQSSGAQSVIFSPPSAIEGQTAITVADTVMDQEHQIVAVNSRGAEVIGDTVQNSTAGATRQTTVVFPHLRLANIREVRFQVRPYETVEFPGVVLPPAAPVALGRR